jgi:Fe-S cluster assembly iron-binding protein IscA
MSMITVTPGAARQLAALLDEHQVPRHLVLRVVADDRSHLDVFLESPQAEDITFGSQGREVLAIDAAAAQQLSGTTLHLS